MATKPTVQTSQETTPAAYVVAGLAMMAIAVWFSFVVRGMWTEFVQGGQMFTMLGGILFLFFAGLSMLFRALGAPKALSGFFITIAVACAVLTALSIAYWVLQHP